MGPISIPICQSKLIIKSQRLSRLIPIVYPAIEELVVTAKDNNKVWEVRANLNGEDLLVEKVVDDAGQLHYHLKEVELPLEC